MLVEAFDSLVRSTIHPSVRDGGGEVNSEAHDDIIEELCALEIVLSRILVNL